MDLAYPVFGYSKTAQAGTAEWLQASKDMLIATYTGTQLNQRFILGLPSEDEPMFGSHLREAANTLRRLLSR